MKKYLYDYIKEICDILDSDKEIKQDFIKKHLIKIDFFQHERFIHLLVTLFYAVIFLIFMGLGYIHWIFLPIALILMIFLICYVLHYFHLENGVQYLYKQYDKMLEKIDKKNK